MENEDWIIRLSLSKPREVKWLKGSDSIIETSEKYEVSVTDDGLTHTLTIQNIVMGDGGVYTVEINDKEYGAITSFASLNVKGTSCIATLLSTNVSSHFYSTTVNHFNWDFCVWELHVGKSFFFEPFPFL